MDSVMSAVERFIRMYLQGRRADGTGAPVTITSTEGMVVYRGQTGVRARSVVHGEERPEEVFLLEEESALNAVKFGCAEGSGYLSASRSGIVRVDAGESDSAFWEIEEGGGGDGGMKVRNRASGLYLRIDPNGKVSAGEKRVRKGSSVRVIHATRWKSKSPRRSVVIRSMQSSRALSAQSGGLLSVKDQGQRRLTEREVFDMDFEALSSLATLTSRSEGRKVLTRKGGDIELGEHGWFVLEPHQDYVALRGPHGYLSSSSEGKLRINRETIPGKAEMFLMTSPPTKLAEITDEEVPIPITSWSKGRVRHVDASISVPTKAVIPYLIVTDWDKLSSFTTKVQGAERIDAAKNAAFTVADNDYLVQITQKHQFLFFRKLDKMLMEVHENKAAHQCSTKMLQSGLLSVYDCTWKVLPNNERRNESVLHIALEFSPSIPIPGFILDGLIQKDTEGTLRELRREAIRRSRLS